MKRRTAVGNKVRLVAIFGCCMLAAICASFALAQEKPAVPAGAPKPAVPAPAKPPAAPGSMDVKYDAGRLSVKVTQADLSKLLQRISEASGVPIEIGPGVSGKVTISLSTVPLEEGINRILETAGEKNLATTYAKKPGAKKDEFKIEKITVVRAAPAAQRATDAEIVAAISKRDQEYRDFFAKMDKERNKIAAALKEYKDPSTSDAKKRKLRTYLRQTPVDKPDDKKLLKGASLDPRYSHDPVLGDIHMALLHAIQAHPEESDKEYMLDLLQRKIPPGWLMYAMVNAWDERYVPYLLDYAKQGDDVAIEILGAQRVKAAVPVLEEVIKNEKINMSFRGTAVNSLWLITGKRYQIEGWGK